MARIRPTTPSSSLRPNTCKYRTWSLVGSLAFAAMVDRSRPVSVLDVHRGGDLLIHIVHLALQSYKRKRVLQFDLSYIIEPCKRAHAGRASLSHLGDMPVCYRAGYRAF